MTVLRLAPDDLRDRRERRGVGSRTPTHAIVVPDTASWRWCSIGDVRRTTLEWQLPAGGPALLQGGRRGPGQALARGGGAVLLICPPPYARELEERLGGPMNEYVETLLDPLARRAAEPKAYDVVIIGGGGHGLSTAYHLATRHGITNVAVLEADYIASGNTGRNTTIIRANYGIPEAVRFYQHSLELLPGRSRTRPAPRSSTRPRGSSGSPTRRWRCGPSGPRCR